MELILESKWKKKYGTELLNRAQVTANKLDNPNDKCTSKRKNDKKNHNIIGEAKVNAAKTNKYWNYGNLNLLFLEKKKAIEKWLWINKSRVELQQANGQCHIYEAHIIQANKRFWFSAAEIDTKTDQQTNKQIQNY